MGNQADIHAILRQYFGHQTFRPLQEEIIRSVLAGKDTLALLPTGGGKSICYQVPGLALPGLCLVVSPLIALMKDQVEALKRKNISAEAVFSGMNHYQIERVLDNATYGHLKFLYLSPERLITDMFRDRLPYMNLSLVAVDEAHCISQWGYDFRPPYLRIAEIRPYFPEVPILALTATATPEVVEDIQKQLAFKEKNVLSKSFSRPNLIYVVQKEQDKGRRLLNIAQRLGGSGIVYVRNRKRTVEIARFLMDNKITAGVYHAGLTTKERDAQQLRWMKNEAQVMVATNAFGMGIDKPDVRYVVHVDIPDSPEAYFQEAGRAGRDGQKAWGILLYDETDLHEIREHFENSWPSPSLVKSIYSALGNYVNLAVGAGKDQSFDFDLSDFVNRYNFKPVIAFNALRLLEQEGYIALNDALDSPSMIVFRLNNEGVYRFQVENKRFTLFIKTLTRLYGGGLFTDYSRISEENIAASLKLSVADVEKLLNELDQMEVLSYIPRKTKPQLVFVNERIDPNSFYLSPETYYLRKEAAQRRLDAMIHYVTDERHCRSQLLLSYFGENESRRCGYCDYCIKRNKVELSDYEFTRILGLIKPILKTSPLSIRHLLDSINETVNEEDVLQVIQFLIESGKVEKQGDLFFWKRID
ncbi:MAG: RecQ family ATP-dependent DNA helicase [Bacteroidales bacterium]|mgnify:CR=1 FL=1|jgi:ATP-dependent DNA helicase RecQ|nr:RecQ family ATP-dependent DNA helicase [Bacteroidales bacterium]